VIGRIVETEAYTEDDPASHSFGGVRVRNKPMFGPSGTAYVYRSYGIHHCMNVVTGKCGVGEAVLIRALEPIVDLQLMAKARGLAQGTDPRRLCSGPGNVCQALQIGMEWNGHSLLDSGDLYLAPSGEPRPGEGSIVVTRRVGITKGMDLLRRFYLEGNAYVSRGVGVRAARISRDSGGWEGTFR